MSVCEVWMFTNFKGVDSDNIELTF
jgi:hypothetical protein